MSVHATFLGTGGIVSTMARVPSVFPVNRDGERLLFDYGEDTQRQMVRYRTRSSVNRPFVTHLHGDHILGIPGLIQTLDFNDRNSSLAVHGPPGNRGHPEQFIHAGGYQPGFHISVHKVRSRNVVYRADDYEARAFDTEHRAASVGYALIEGDHPGRFDREEAEKLGILIGPAFSRLHTGGDVELEDGTVTHFEQMVGDPRPGKIVVYTGDTRPLNSAVGVVCDISPPVHDAAFIDEETERARQTTHSTAREAARVAHDTNMRRFTLTYISARHTAGPSPLLEQAHEVYDGGAFVTEDGQKLEVSYTDSDGGGAEAGE